METNLSELVGEHPEWRLLLQAYAAAEAEIAEQLAVERSAAKRAAKSAARAIGGAPAAPEPAPADEAPIADPASEDASGDDDQRKQTWVRRMREVAGIPVDRLAPIHGRLIAEGLLQFSLGGRDEGVLYRLTRDARQLLSALPPLVADTTGETTVRLDESVAPPSRAA